MVAEVYLIPKSSANTVLTEIFNGKLIFLFALYANSAMDT